MVIDKRRMLSRCPKGYGMPHWSLTCCRTMPCSTSWPRFSGPRAGPTALQAALPAVLLRQRLPQSRVDTHYPASVRRGIDECPHRLYARGFRMDRLPVDDAFVDARRRRSRLHWRLLQHRCRLRHFRLMQPHPHRVPGAPRSPRDLQQRHLLVERHPPDLDQHAHRDHIFFPCSKIEQGMQSQGSNVDANPPQARQFCTRFNTRLKMGHNIQKRGFPPEINRLS